MVDIVRYKPTVREPGPYSDDQYRPAAAGVLPRSGIGREIRSTACRLAGS